MTESEKTPGRGEPSTELAIVFPILPGMSEQVERLAAVLGGAKSEEFRRSQENLGVRKESWFLNRSPRGDSVTVCLESADVALSLAKLVQSETPTDLWLKSEVRNVTGIDFTGATQLTLPKQILRYPA